MNELYDKLAHKLKTEALTRGPNKGRAPAQKKWAVSGHNSYIEWDGEDIVCNYENTQVIRVSKQGCITTISLNTNGWYSAPTTRAYIWDVAGISVHTQSFKGRNHTVVRLSDGRKVLFYDHMVLDGNYNLITPPQEFVGSRVDKKESAEMRANFKLVYDTLPMYHLAHNGFPPSSKHTFPSYLPWRLWQPHDVELRLEELLAMVLHNNIQSRWVPGNGTVLEAGTLAQCRQWLNRQLTVYEDYNTGLFYIDQ